jgi:CubicO group peptidase (beta-lactamase class C family)
MSMTGFSKTRLGRVRGALDDHVQGGAAPGVVAVLARGGETVLEATGDVQPDSIFRIASMSKPVAAAAALILVEECVLRLDDPVDEYLPELADRRVLTRPDGPLDDTVPAERAITLRDLLTFQLGLGFGAGLWGPPGTLPIMDALAAELGGGRPGPAAVPEPDEWMRRLGRLPLIYQPGQRWLYNLGSDILGVLIARAAGQPFDEFLRERLFEPLGMADTGFWVPAASLGRLLPQYTSDETGQRVVYDPPDGQWATPPAFASGAGGLVSTAEDYLAFASMLRGGGAHRGVRILSRAAVSLMISDQLPAAVKAVSGLAPGDFDATGWGFGVSVVTRRTELYHGVGTYGWSGGLGTSWVNDPAEDLTLILLTQQAFTSAAPPTINRDFWTSAYQALDD